MPETAEHPLGEFYRAARLVSEDLLAGPRCPRSGAPLPEPEPLGELPYAMRARMQRDEKRREAWFSLPTQTRTQAVAQLRYPRAEGHRLYRCRLAGENPASDKPMDLSIFPEILLYAPNEPTAESFYRSLCGITSTREFVRVVVLPATEEEAAPL